MMLAPLRRRDFALVWTAGLISTLGDWALIIALPFYVYDLVGSTLATGAMLLASTAPRVLFGSVAGVFVDRWDRRWTMVGVDVLRTVLLLPLLLVHGPDTVWVVYAVGVAQATVGQFFGPAKAALVPRLVEPEELVAANALNAQVDATVGLVGPALGAALATAAGIAGAVTIDSASFLVSAALLVLVSGARGAAPARAARPVAGVAAARWVSFWKEWGEGLRFVRERPELSALLVVLAAVVLADGVANVLWTPLARSVLGVGPVELGWLVSATGVGRVAGLFLIARAGVRLQPAHLIVVGTATAAVMPIGVALVPSFWLMLAVAVVPAPWIPGINVGVQTITQQHTEDRVRGRVFGAQNATAGLVTLSGMLISSAAGDAVGVLPLLAVSGGLYIVAAGVAALVLRRSRTRLMPDDVAVAF